MNIDGKEVRYKHIGFYTDIDLDLFSHLSTYTDIHIPINSYTCMMIGEGQRGIDKIDR